MQVNLSSLLRLRDTAARFEKRIAISVCAFSLLVPIFSAELFPFSRFPMFSDNPTVLVRSKAFDPSGRELSLSEIGILNLLVANPRPVLNIVPQRPLEAAYRWWEPAEFAPFVQASIRERGLSEPVRFVQERIGEVSRGGRISVGAVDTRSWNVYRDSVQLNPR